MTGYEFGNYGSCEGDVGGPLILYIYQDGLNKAHFVQIGIVQGDVGICGNRNLPSIYVRLENEEVLRFIREATGTTVCSTVCSRVGNRSRTSMA